MILGLAITIAVLIPLGVMCWLVATAPLGWEDENGFHTANPMSTPTLTTSESDR